MLKGILDAAINFHLVVHQANHVINHFIRGHAEILWRRIVSVYHARDCCWQQRLAATGILHEVQEEDVVEITLYLGVIVEVEVVVQLGKLQYHLDGLGLVVSRKTAMLPSFENPIATLEDQVRTDRVFGAVKSFIEGLLLGQKHHCAVVFGLTWGTETALKHCALDVSPDVWRIVTVQIDYRFR